MAEITLHDATIILAMSRLEHLEGFRGDLDAPLTAVTAVRAVDDPWPELRGMRAPGTGLPGVVAVGTRRPIEAVGVVDAWKETERGAAGCHPAMLRHGRRT